MRERRSRSIRRSASRGTRWVPATIARLEAEIAKLTEFLSAPDLFTKEPAKFKKATEAIAERQTALAKAEEEWLLLAERE